MGGATEVETNEIRDRIIDSLNAGRSALQDGVLPGGGSALYQASKLIEASLTLQNDDEKEGLRILLETLQEPIRNIIKNALDSDQISHILSKLQFGQGYDAKDHRIINMFDAGILDSFRVIKSVVFDSIGLSTLILQTECLVLKDKSYSPQTFKHFQSQKDMF